jgi:hypothetical protein
MSKGDSDFELPKNLERYLSALSKLYAQEGNRQLQELVVNAQTRVIEEWSVESWDGRTYGHALYLVVPESLFLRVTKRRSAIQRQIKADLNDIHNVQHEFVAEVFLEMETAEDREWRKESGLLLASERLVPPSVTKRIWKEDGFRVFLSHKAEVKKQTADLKESLLVYGISSFVAHADIRPTKAWQDEIENALSTMDAFVALMTKNFHESDWTDQEVGFALARGVPMIAVKLDRDPYGFIGKFQALTCSWAGAAKEVARVLIRHERMVTAYIKAVQGCKHFSEGNDLAALLPDIDQLTNEQADALVSAFNENGEVSGSFGFNGTKPGQYGEGLFEHLKRLNGRKYKLTSSGNIKVTL